MKLCDLGRLWNRIAKTAHGTANNSLHWGEWHRSFDTMNKQTHANSSHHHNHGLLEELVLENSNRWRKGE